MLETTGTAIRHEGESAVGRHVEWISRMIPPLWDLPNFVAVNPFHGLSHAGILEASRMVNDGLGASFLPGIGHYQDRWRRGEFCLADLEGPARRAGMDAGRLAELLKGRVSPPLRWRTLWATFAERIDRAHGTDWDSFLMRSAARWCADHATRPEDGRGLFPAWLESCRHDFSFEIMGLRGFRAWASSLPNEPVAVISKLLERLEIPAERARQYLTRLTAGLYGWASHFRGRSWLAEPSGTGELPGIIAIRVVLDAAVALLSGRKFEELPAEIESGVEDETAILVFQEALEEAHSRRLFETLRLAPAPSPAAGSALAVFCIDVRSERLRRHLELANPDVRTAGFAGFFGVSLELVTGGHPSSRCPALLKPAVSLLAAAAGPNPAPSLDGVKSAPASAFAFMEWFGLSYAFSLARNALGWKAPASNPDNASALGKSACEQIPAATRLAIARGILSNLGVGDRFPRLVLLCGHEGVSANNPHAAGLDCGACGGHGGGVNARVACAILNDADVRSGLAEAGWNVPPETCFVPGVHRTSTDEVIILDAGQVPFAHAADLAALKSRLGDASARCRRERAADLGSGIEKQPRLAATLSRRSADWAETRPEWALARNASFIAARRSRTRGLDLAGRSFLHEYDARLDPEGATLSLILSAPVVVASWINWQYFASTVNNRFFGSGDKTIHNRVGTIGVVEGNGGDLRPGLPMQSVHEPDGTWFHEPLRLHVVVEAAPEKIDRVIAAIPIATQLVANGWIRLSSLDPEGGAIRVFRPQTGWESA